jgi:hypothetical protein
MRVVHDDGRHVLAVGDVERGAIDDLRSYRVGRGSSPVVDAIYTDPPWNAGIARLFRRWAKRDEGPVDLNFLFHAFVAGSLKICPAGPWCIEMGSGGLAAILDVLRAFGVGVVGVLETTNDESKANARAYLITADPRLPVREGYVPPRAAGDMDGTALRRAALDQMKSMGIATILDPFAGYGGILKEVDARGMAYCGIELNESRLQRAVNFLNDGGRDAKAG